MWADEAVLVNYGVPGDYAGSSPPQGWAWFRRMDRRHALIAAGGLFTAEDAFDLIRAGASLVQLHTAMVYRGPGVVRAINEGLARLLEGNGFRTLAEAVGTMD